MKHSFIILIAFVLVSMSLACNQGTEASENDPGDSDSMDQTGTADHSSISAVSNDSSAVILGQWHLVKLEGADSLTPCEKQMVFEFSDQKGEPISGYQTRALYVKQSDTSCRPLNKESYSSLYTFVSGNLFIKNIRMEGRNFSGSFDIVEMSGDHMVLETLKKRFFFKKML